MLSCCPFTIIMLDSFKYYFTVHMQVEEVDALPLHHVKVYVQATKQQMVKCSCVQSRINSIGGIWFHESNSSNVQMYERVYMKISTKNYPLLHQVSFFPFFLYIYFFFFLSFFLFLAEPIMSDIDVINITGMFCYYYRICLIICFACTFWIEEESVDLMFALVEDTTPICPPLSPLPRRRFLRRLRESERKRKWLWITATCINFNVLC